MSALTFDKSSPFYGLINNRLQKNIDGQSQIFMQTERVLEIISGSKTTYTFAIQRPSSDDVLENIVITEQNGIYTYHLMQYHLTAADRELLRQDKSIDMNNKVDITRLEVDNPEELYALLNTPSLGNIDDDCVDYHAIGGDMCPDNIHDTAEMLSGKCEYVNNDTYFPSSFPVYNALVDISCVETGSGESTDPDPNPGTNPPDDTDPGDDTTPVTGTPGDSGENPGNEDEDPEDEDPEENEPGMPTKPIDLVLNSDYLLKQELDADGLEAWENLSESQQSEITDFLDDNRDDNVLDEEAVDFAEEVIENPDAEVDFEDRIIEKFEGTQTDCVHEMLKTDGNNFTLYDSLLNNFNGYFGDHLILEVGDTGTDWGYTTGQTGTDNDIIDNPNFYNVTISNDLNEIGSNLAITVTLIHEIMHAYMYQSLFDAGLIEFHESGDAVPVGNLCNLTLSLDNYTIGELFSAYICELDQNNELDEQWSHEIFNNNIFSVTSFQEQIADYIYQNHNWDSENPNFIFLMEDEFGTDWKQMVSELTSWVGLESTSEFDTWANANNIQYDFDSEGKITGEMALYRSYVKDIGNQNCN